VREIRRYIRNKGNFCNRKNSYGKKYFDGWVVVVKNNSIRQPLTDLLRSTSFTGFGRAIQHDRRPYICVVEFLGGFRFP